MTTRPMFEGARPRPMGTRQPTGWGSGCWSWPARHASRSTWRTSWILRRIDQLRNLLADYARDRLWMIFTGDPGLEVAKSHYADQKARPHHYPGGPHALAGASEPGAHIALVRNLGLSV